MTTSLDKWLRRLEQRTGSAIELGLDRVAHVARALELDFSDVPVITVAGTNGKGSVVAYLEFLYREAGFRPFAYTSPHLLEFSERIRLAGADHDGDAIADALDRVEAARGDTRLTYFEHTTLAAFCIAAAARPDVMLLEVGLGGRLDAVNIVDPDVAVITSIGLDHLEWLGPDRDSVAREKCGIARAGRPLVVGDTDPPASLEAAAAEVGAQCLMAGRDFQWRGSGGTWSLQTPNGTKTWPLPAMRGAHQLGNAACALLAAEHLRERLPFDDAHFRVALEGARLPGRFQSLGGRPEIVVDVGHNAEAAAALAAQLDRPAGRIFAVVGMLADKNAAGAARELGPKVDAWLCAGLEGDRGRDAESLVEALRDGGIIGRVEALKSVSEALERARRQASPEDLILVFGSFLTAAEALKALSPDSEV